MGIVLLTPDPDPAPEPDAPEFTDASVIGELRELAPSSADAGFDVTGRGR